MKDAEESPANETSSAVDCDEARRELDRLLSDTRFHIANRNRAFLRYIADETFNGRAKGVKAYSIAIDVFARPSNFDPNTDPIVRIEAARLRAALDQYYEAHGEPGGVRITLPRGNYIAEFSRIANDSVARTIDQVSSQPRDVPNRTSAASSRTNAPVDGLASIILGTAFFVIMTGLGAWFIFDRTAQPAAPTNVLLTKKPLVTITTSARGATSRDQIENLDDDLLVALSRFGTLRFSINQAGDEAKLRATRRLGLQSESDASDYQIAVKYDLQSKLPSATWQVIDPQSGETLASGEESVDNPTAVAGQSAYGLIATLAIRFGSNTGTLNSIERDKAYPADAEGNICVLKGEYAINTYNKDQLDLARSCLERTVTANGRLDDAKAVLARILVINDEWDGTKAGLPLAAKLADEAMLSAPSSDRSLLARMYVQFASGQLDAAFATGRTLIARNPLNVDAAAALALRLYLSGSSAEGVEIASRVVSTLDPGSCAANIVLAFDAYSNGDGREALRRLNVITSDGFLVRYVRVASLVQLGMRSEASAAFEAAVRVDPQFASRFRSLSSVRHYDVDINASITRDIATAQDWSAQKIP